MCRSKLQCISKKMFCLLIFLFIASESMAQVPFLPVPLKQNQTLLPFTLPEELFPNSYPVFTNAREMREIEYTEMGRILVYFYDTKEAAENDMKLFTGKNRKISSEDSSILAAHYGCWEENEQFATGWFTIGSYIVGLRTPTNKSSRALLSKTAEKIITDYDARIKLMFSTPEKCFNTYLEAVKNQQGDLIIECLYNDGSEESRNAIAVIKNLISAIPMISMYERPRPQKEIIIDKVETVSATEARIGVLRQKEYDDSMPFIMLTFGLPLTNQLSTGEHLWIPMKMNGEKWGIDILTVQKLAFAKSREQSLQSICISNLKQIGLGLQMYASDHKDTFPDDIREVALHYTHGTALKCPGDKTTPEIQKVEPDTPISYTYVKGLSRQNPNSYKIIILYDSSPDYHQGKGRNILFIDGHVEWMPEEKFQKLLGEQKF